MSRQHRRCVVYYPTLKLILKAVRLLKRRYPEDDIRVISREKLKQAVEAAKYAIRYTKGSCMYRRIVAAAHLFYEIIMLHPLTDGNKRLAVQY